MITFAADASGRLDFVNGRWWTFSGYDPATHNGEPWMSVVHPDDAEPLRVAWDRSIATGDELAIEVRVRKADGSYHWAVVSAAAVRSGDGVPERWYGTVVPLEREAAHNDPERRFRAFAEAIPVICWTADARGWIDWYNHRWYEYTGQSPEEAAGWGWQAAHHPDDFLEVMRRWPHSVATGEPFEMEYRMRRKDGVFHWFLARAEPVHDGRGKVVRWYGSTVDIETQRRALERTKRVAETLHDVFLPKTLPQCSDLRLDAVYLPAEKDALVGGDWFDAFELPDGQLVFSIGDVAGHGLQASIMVGRLRQAIFALAFQSNDPAEILQKTDRILTHQDPDTIVTALVGVVDRTHTTMTYASAGHPPPLIAYRTGEPAEMLPCGQAPLGVGGGPALRNYTVPIARDAVVAVYTDGMTEFSRDVAAAEAKLRTAVALLVGNTTIARPAVAVKEIVLNDAPTRDDAALLIMQFSAVEPATLQSDPTTLQKTWRFHSSDAYAAHTSRHEIMAYLRRMAIDPDEAFTAELVVGEILANTVEHAPGLVEVQVDWTGQTPILLVRDTGPGLTTLAATLPQDVMNESGRGIFLVNALSREATTRPSPGYGSEIRVVLPMRRQSPVVAASPG